MLRLNRTFFSKIALFFILPLFFIFLFLASPNPSQAALVQCGTATCDTSVCTGFMCNGPGLCQTQCMGCSHASLNQCAFEWALGTQGSPSQCAVGSVCNPANVKYNCNPTGNVCEPCAAGASCQNLTAGCPGTACAPVDPGPGPAPAPVGKCPKCTSEYPIWDSYEGKCYKYVKGTKTLQPGETEKVSCTLPDKCWAGCGCGINNPCLGNTFRDPGFLPCGKDGSNCVTAIGNINATDFTSIVKRLFSVLLGLGGIIAILLIIWSGYKLTTSRGDPERLQNAREQLTAAIVGLLFIIFSLLILQVIGYNILGISAFRP